jgi:hypothetical protein
MVKARVAGPDSAAQWIDELDALRRSIAEDMADDYRPSETRDGLTAWRVAEHRWRDADDGSPEKRRLTDELSRIRQRYLDAVAEAQVRHASSAPTITGVAAPDRGSGHD